MLSKAAMLNLDLEVLPQRLEECKKHLESVKKDLQALLDSFGSAIALEMASVKDLKLKYNELLKDDKNPVHYNKENKGVLKHLIENSKENVDLNAF